MTKSIDHQFFFPHPPAVVWDYLTKAELMEQWLMRNNFVAALGYDFQFLTKPIPALDIDGIFHCKVLEIVPNEKLSYSWKCGPGDGKITLDSIVVWTLEAKENGTQVSLVHSGFSMPENLSIYSGMTDGWLSNLKKLNERIATAAHDTART